MLEGCRLETAHDTEVFFLIVVSLVSLGLVVSPGIEDLEFPLSQVVNLQKAALEGTDHASSSECDEEFFDWIEIHNATGQPRNRLYELLVRKTANRDALLPSSRLYPIRNIAGAVTRNLSNLLVGEQRSLGGTPRESSYADSIHDTLRFLNFINCV